MRTGVTLKLAAIRGVVLTGHPALVARHGRLDLLAGRVGSTRARLDTDGGRGDAPQGSEVMSRADEERHPSVVIAEDDVLLREGLASLLQGAGFDVVGQAGDASQLLELVAQHEPGLVLVDIRMPPSHSTEGLDAARRIRAEHPSTGVLVLSAHVEVEHALDLIAGGEGTGYLLKSRVTEVDEFLETLDRIAKGGSVVDPALVQELVQARHKDDPLAELSDREREVLSLMAEGRSNAGIAHQLWVTEGTVEKHVRSILAKLPLEATADDHRRVLAVLAFLESR